MSEKVAQVAQQNVEGFVMRRRGGQPSQNALIEKEEVAQTSTPSQGGGEQYGQLGQPISRVVADPDDIPETTDSAQSVTGPEGDPWEVSTEEGSDER